MESTAEQEKGAAWGRIGNWVFSDSFSSDQISNAERASRQKEVHMPLCPRGPVTTNPGSPESMTTGCPKARLDQRCVKELGSLEDSESCWACIFRSPFCSYLERAGQRGGSSAGRCNPLSTSPTSCEQNIVGEPGSTTHCHLPMPRAISPARGARRGQGLLLWLPPSYSIMGASPVLLFPLLSFSS